MSRGRPPANTTKLATVDTVEPTRHLSEPESEAWRRWVGVVQATRPFLSTDAPLLTALVELECRKARARAALEGVDPYGDGKRHPALTDLDNAHRDFMALLRELGLTPASAKNVRSEKRTPEADKLDEFLRS
jgi:phage terminase small subunit